MELSIQDIEALGKSARIAFRSEEEKERLCQELRGMIAHAEALQKPLLEFEPVDGEEACTVWREDNVAPSMPRKTLLDVAPMTEGEYVVVPRAVEA